MDQSSKNVLSARIDKLEALLLSVTSSTAQIPTSEFTCADRSEKVTSGVSDGHSGFEGGNEVIDMEKEQESDQIIEALGSMKVDQIENKTIYLGGAHWVSIMSEVSHRQDQLRSRVNMSCDRLKSSGII